MCENYNMQHYYVDKLLFCETDNLNTMQVVTRTPTLQITLVATCLIALEDYRFFFLYIVSQRLLFLGIPFA